jgi:pimeloyl-ACP methyl ester carboxylesterase
VREWVRTEDGRVLRVDWTGDPDGQPVFLLHGMPGSRVGPRPRGMVLYHRRIRLISYDRPGYGGSDRQPGRHVSDLPRDVEAVADALGLDRFAVVGRSAGAPHALACAALLPKRVTRVAALVSLAPVDAKGIDWFAGMAKSNIDDFRTAVADPEDLARRIIQRSQAIRTDPARLIEGLRRELTDDDLRVLSDIGLRSMLLRTYGEALRHSAYGWIDDALALCRPWGFDPADVRAPALLWHGRRDVFSPAAHAAWLASRIPRVRAILEPAAAHFAAFRVLPAVLRWVVDPMAV